MHCFDIVDKTKNPLVQAPKGPKCNNCERRSEEGIIMTADPTNFRCNDCRGELNSEIRYAEINLTLPCGCWSLENKFFLLSHIG